MFFKFLLFCLLEAVSLEGCTRIFYNKDSSHIRFARSMDLFVNDQPRVMIFPRGILRDGQTKRWKSQYGSVVVAGFQKRLITDGMNEKGLAAHLLFQESGEFQEESAVRPSLSNLCLVSFCLDNCKTVNEAIEQLQHTQVVAGKLAYREWPVQLALEDLTGDSAILEFVHGQIIVHQGPQYKVVASNQGYEEQLNRLREYKSFGGKLPIPGDVDPSSRFVRVSTFLKSLPQAAEAISSMFSLIYLAQIPAGVETYWETRWFTVGDLTDLVFYFSSTAQINPLRVELKKFNLAEGSEIKEFN
jgi:penicillin V acylase-like amidase (Ntn superfamily)